MMLPRGSFVITIAALCAAASSASASSTIATFADPAPTSATPLFTRNGNVFSGGWSGLGLVLQTPGTPAPDFSDATFFLTPLFVTNDFGSFAELSGGSAQFFDSSSNPILRIDFTAANLSNVLSLGASDFLAQNVTFSGTALGGLTLTNESFGFSFANPVIADRPLNQHYTVTSAFTSSADIVVPGPGTAGLAMVAGLAAMRRRRRA